MSDDRMFLFKITTDSCEPFKGKSKDILENMIKNSDEVDFYVCLDSTIEIAFYKEKQND